MQKFNEVLSYIDKYYLDSVNEKELFDGAIVGMLKTLDPHSAYATAEENKQLMESLNGAFEGVGIQFSIMNDTVMVVATTSGGPSEKVGIRAGDRIVTVDEETIAGVGISEERVFKLLRGPKDTQVKIGIYRPSLQDKLSFTVTRDEIETYTLDIAYMLNSSTGYIKLNQFGENTYMEFALAISKLKAAGMTSLVLDLRGNSGGYLGAAIQICDAFLPSGEMIVYTQGAKTPSEKIQATATGCWEKGKLVVLIDEFSASASEIVAGAIQDNDRGIIVGRRSFGKGLVQQQFELSDKSSLRLTIARYYTPSGRCIQRNYDKGTDDYYEDLLRRYEHGEMTSSDSIKLDKTLRYTTKKGRVVYGGGGIMPDHFVPLEVNDELVPFNAAFNSGLVVEFAFHYTTLHEQNLRKTYPTVNQFISKMNVSDAVVQEFLRFYQNKNGRADFNDTAKKELKLWLKALIGRNLYRDEGFYPIINTTDAAVLKALEVLK